MSELQGSRAENRRMVSIFLRQFTPSALGWAASSCLIVAGVSLPIPIAAWLLMMIAACWPAAIITGLLVVNNDRDVFRLTRSLKILVFATPLAALIVTVAVMAPAGAEVWAVWTAVVTLSATTSVSNALLTDRLLSERPVQ